MNTDNCNDFNIKEKFEEIQNHVMSCVQPVSIYFFSLSFTQAYDHLNNYRAVYPILLSIENHRKQYF